MPHDGDRRRLPRPRPPGSRSRPARTQAARVDTPPKVRTATERRRKGISVYLDPFQKSLIEDCAMERGQDASWLLREAGLFEVEHQLSALAQGAKFGDKEAAIRLVQTALGLARMSLSDLLPPPEPVEIIREVIRHAPAPTSQPSAPPALPPPAPIQPASRPPEPPTFAAQPVYSPPADDAVEAARRGPTRRSAGPPTIAQEAAHSSDRAGFLRSDRALRFVDAAADAIKFCWRWVKAFAELFGFLLSEIFELFTCIVRGWMRGGSRRDEWSQQPERWSTGAVIRLLVLIVGLLMFLPVNLGPGAIGYFLLGGHESALSEVAKRSPGSAWDRWM